jgi:putative transposase
MLGNSDLIVYLDKVVMTIFDKAALRRKTVVIAIGVGVDGVKDVLGAWIQQVEGAKFWLSIFADLKHRGLQDILILCAEGPSDLLRVVASVFPGPTFQTSITHIVRASVRYVPCKERKAVCADLRRLYTAETREAAEHMLDEYERRWSPRYRPMIASWWRKRWHEIVPFFDLPPEIRKAICMANAIEALNSHLRRASKAAGQIPSDDEALKLLFIAIRNAKKVWGRPFPQWNRCGAQFAIHFQDRFDAAMTLPGREMEIPRLVREPRVASTVMPLILS